MTIADAESGAIMFGRTAVGVVSEHAAVATTAVARAVGTRREAAERVPRAALVMAGIAAIVGGLLARVAFDRVAAIPADARLEPA